MHFLSDAQAAWAHGVSSLLAGFAGAWLWRALALRRGWLDQPDDRRLHVVPTPRGGGVGIALALLASSLAVAPPAVAAGLLVTAGSGLYDDLRPLRAVPKLALQLIGTLPLASTWPLAADAVGPVAGVLLAWGVAMGLVNAWNFMDGSNGLVASQAVLVGVAAAALAVVSAAAPAADGLGLLAVALAAACLGFLPLNVPRARVFLGDVGSHAIGYGAAALALLAAQVPGIPGAVVWLPASAIVVDTALTLASRVRRREKFWLGHREHLYQRAIAAGWSHVGIAAVYGAWTLAASALALASSGASAAVATGATAAVYAAGILAYLAAGRHWPRPARTTENQG